MSDYCTVAQIQDEFKGFTASTTTTPKLATVERFITEESNHIDGVIGVKYVTPVIEANSPKAWSILRKIAIFRASQRVKNVMEVKGPFSQQSSEEKASQNYVRTPNSDLKDIAKGDLLLEDAPLKNPSGGVDGTCGVDCEVSTCHTFDINKDQW